MKATKIFISVFFATFLISYVLVQTAKQITAPAKTFAEEPRNVAAFQSALPPPIIEVEADNQLNEENQDSDANYKIKLLTVGEGFHGDEVKAKSGEKWLGLFKEKDKYFLRLAPIKIRFVYDPFIDGYEEKYAKRKTGKSISVKSVGQPIFLLKNAEMLRGGEIKTLLHNTSNDNTDISEGRITSFENNFIQNFQIGLNKYVLRVEEISRKGEKFLALTLEAKGTKQILHSIKSGHTDSLGVLHWIGDLDRDGNPDLFAALYVHDNVLSQNLFLSSEAEKGKLMKKVAVFVTTGC